jgi:hypothetical protein
MSQIHNQDSHMSLPRSRSHNGPTNPGNKPQTIPKRKHDTRSKGLRTLHNTRRTVREAGTDGLRPSSGQSVKYNRTSSTAPWKMDGPRLVPGRSASNRCHVDSPRPPGRQFGRHADGPVPLHGRSDKPLAAKLWHPEGSTRKLARTGWTHEEHDPRE